MRVRVSVRERARVRGIASLGLGLVLRLGLELGLELGLRLDLG